MVLQTGGAGEVSKPLLPVPSPCIPPLTTEVGTWHPPKHPVAEGLALPDHVVPVGVS